MTRFQKSVLGTIIVYIVFLVLVVIATGCYPYLVPFH